MKKNFLPVIAAVALSVLSCCTSCNPPENNENGEEQEKETTTEPEKLTVKPGTYKFTAPPMKGKWEAGDKIYVHGAYGPAAQVITLQAGDISSDGKTASGELDGVTEFPCQPDGLYAAWPADAVREEDGLQASVTWFSSGLYSPLGVAYLNGDTFQFIDATCALTFTVTGDFDSYAIAANNRDGLRLKEFQADYTSAETAMSRNTDGYPFRYGEVKSGQKVTIYFPGLIRFKQGFSIFFGKNEKYNKCYTVNDAINIKAGQVQDLGDITASLANYNGPAPKMPEMTGYKKFEVKLNELSGLCKSADGTFLWGVGDGGELAQIQFDGKVVDKWSIGGDTEGLTMDPDTKDLYVSMEPHSVGIIKAPDYKTKSTLFKIPEAAKYGNAGLEGITYYKDGLIYCGAQTSANLFLCDLSAELDSNKNTTIVSMTSLAQNYPGIIDEIGGLCYDPLTDWLWVTDSNYYKIFAFTGDGQTLLAWYSVKVVVNAESIFVDHDNNCIWVGCDNDGATSHLFRFDFTGLDDAIINK